VLGVQCSLSDERLSHRVPGSPTAADRAPLPRTLTPDVEVPDNDGLPVPLTAAAAAAAVAPLLPVFDGHGTTIKQTFRFPLMFVTQQLPVCVGHVVAVTDLK